MAARGSSKNHTARYGVVGNPVSHSWSPRIHELFAAQLGLRLRYERILADSANFASTVRDFQHSGGSGLNITLPFKEQAARLADTLSPTATRTGAANTLLFRADGGIHGENTDGAGLVRDLNRHGLLTPGQRILIVGAGGAARGIIPALLAATSLSLVLANRTPERAERLAADFQPLGALSHCPLSEVAARRCEGIINATSASLSGAPPALPAPLFRHLQWGYDLAYAQTPTPFLHLLETHKVAHRHDGLGMLVEQAAESFLLWHGVRPNTPPILQSLRPPTP